MVFLHKSGESFTANFASYSRHGMALSDSFGAPAKQPRLVGIATVSFTDEQALLGQLRPHAFNIATPS
jgi:hypothetical protein